jgi:hypothetical protein
MVSVSVFDNAILENSEFENMFTFRFNILNVSESNLLYVALYIFKIAIEKSSFSQIDEGQLTDFIIDVKYHYNNVPYHNIYHAIHVLHMTYCMLDNCNAFKTMNPLIVFSTLLSSLTHDIGHTGTNNDFHIKTISEIAEKYNNISVLEQYHCNLTFELINKWNLFDKLTREEFIICRTTILGCILGTDLSKHKNIVSQLEVYINNGFTIENISEQYFLSEIIVHAADLSNPTFTFSLCKEWSIKINQEFKNQVEQELELNMKPSFTTDPKLFEIQEYKYITYICKPYWELVYKIIPNLDEPMTNIIENAYIWETLSNK